MPTDPTMDPTRTNADAYRVVFENERVRVLEYHDTPGHRTTPHAHPDSVMYTLSSFRRRLVGADQTREVEMPSGLVGWLPAQEHAGENIGDSDTVVLFVELKEPAPDGPRDTAELGPAGPDGADTVLD